MSFLRRDFRKIIEMKPIAHFNLRVLINFYLQWNCQMTDVWLMEASLRITYCQHCVQRPCLQPETEMQFCGKRVDSFICTHDPHRPTVSCGFFMPQRSRKNRQSNSDWQIHSKALVFAIVVKIVGLLTWRNVTEYFSTKYCSGKTKSDKNLSINFEQSELQRVNCVKYLGVNMDDKMSWQKHFDVLETKLSSAIGALFKLRKHLSLKALITVYHRIVYSHLQNGILAWRKTNKTRVYELRSKTKFHSKSNKQ